MGWLQGIASYRSSTPIGFFISASILQLHKKCSIGLRFPTAVPPALLIHPRFAWVATGNRTLIASSTNSSVNRYTIATMSSFVRLDYAIKGGGGQRLC